MSKLEKFFYYTAVILSLGGVWLSKVIMKKAFYEALKASKQE